MRPTITQIEIHQEQQAQASVRIAPNGDVTLLYIPVWKPIADAPKGRKLLCGWFQENGIWGTVTACYYTPGTLDAGESCAEADEDGFAPEGWYATSETHDEEMPISKLTHYMLLPAGPEKIG